MSGLLRLCTAGSVDDGKSTLIGRLLYEARGVYEDQLSSVRAASRNRGAGPIDFSLFTDGLRAEREQGITIDVAYRYFATARRKFILADTPGHEQYTRNMATGASTADLAILLVDARHGVRDQTRRHARIARLLGISHFVLAVNKMDLVGFDRGVFESIRDGFSGLLGRRDSARHPDERVERRQRRPAQRRDAVVRRARRCSSISRPSSSINDGHGEPVPLPRPAGGPAEPRVPRLCGPDRVGHDPAGRSDRRSGRRGWQTRVKRIVTWDGDLEAAHAPMSVTLTLEDEVDISRGDVLTTTPAAARTAARRRSMVWMDERPLDPRASTS